MRSPTESTGLTRRDRWLILLAMLLVATWSDAQVTLERGWSAVTALIFESAGPQGARLKLDAGTLVVRAGDDSADRPLRAGALTASRTLTALGAIVWPRADITTSYTMGIDDVLVNARTWTGNLVVTLPNVTAAAGHLFIIKDAAGISGVASRSIRIAGGPVDGANAVQIQSNYGVLRLLVGVNAASKYEFFKW